MFDLKFPERWEKIRFYSLFTENKEENSNFAEDNALQFYFGKIIQKKKFELTDELIGTYKKYTVVKPGDIIINGLNLNYDFVSQRVGIVEENGIITSAYIALRSRDNVNVRYYCYLLKSLDSQKIFHGLGSGVRLTLSYKNLKNIFLPVPPRDEQEKIVRYLDKKTSDMTKFIDAKKKQVELLKELKRSIISDAVTNGLYNDSSQWQKIKLRYVAKLNPSRKKIFLPEDKLSYVPMECVKAGYLIPKEISFKDLISGLTYFEDGDIIFAKVTPCFENGNIAIAENLLNGAAYGSSELFVLKCFDIYKKFLFYFLQSSDFKNECIANMTGTAGLKRVPSKIVMNYKIPLPSLWIQKEIADYLDVECTKIENLIEAIQKEISLVEELRKSLISEVVTGKIDVGELI